MPKIHQLPIHEIQKIAAGEVVDRPANIVKELVENAIDAQATHITIYVVDGGKSLVRVIDNGCGMDHTDAKRCFDHHATSKISTLSDLDTIATFGFRGEALSSIAAVSHVTLTTKELQAQYGITMKLEDGKIIEESIVGANAGTDLSVADIFYNIPARKKFLKTRETEWRHILHLVHAYCLDYCAIHFELFSDETQILNCPPAQDIRERVIQLWHYDLGTTMLTLPATDNDKQISISGIISDHQYGQYDRSHIYFFVNNRWVKNNHLVKALLKGYANVLQPGKFPAAVISILLDPTDLDVNIHPRKEEVKFLHPHTVENLITTSVKIALQNNNRSNIKEPPSVDYEQKPTVSYFGIRSDVPSWQKELHIPEVATAKVEQVYDGIELPSEPAFAPTTQELQAPHIRQEEPPVYKENLSFLPQAQEPHDQVAIIGQFNKTYIVLEHERGLMMIDQHAAHERILYEQFAQRFYDIATVKLLFPKIITLQESDIALLELYKEILHMHGLVIESFGQRQLIVTSTPVTLQNIDLDDLVKQFVGMLHEYEYIDQQEVQDKLTGHLRALMACKAAVKAGDMLNTHQMKTIVDDLFKTDNNLTCPHGRPTRWILDTPEIEKKFKRDYKGKALQGIE